MRNTGLVQTPATRFLDAAGITYEVFPYDHDPNATSFGLEAAEVLGFDPDVVFKTLVADVEMSGARRNELVVAIVPVSAKLDLKALARSAGAKRARMASIPDAERSSGYVAGGISPFGQKKQLRTFVDETAKVCDRIYVSGGRRGLDIGLDPRHLIASVDAVTAPIAAF